MEICPENKSAKTEEQLTKGVLQLYEPQLATIHTQLKELTIKQESVNDLMSSQMRKLDNIQNDATWDAMMAHIASRRARLQLLQRNMMYLHKKVMYLQKRAENIEKLSKKKYVHSSKPSTG
ncbi:hypothetical protein ACJJTC_015945 [Scirpophaga incertulas]